MAEDGNPQYDHSNRAFLQAFFARSTLTFREAQPILAAIITIHERHKVSPKDVTEAVFNSYISAANEAISSFDLEIRSTEHQTSRLRTYALINSTDDPITQLATSHTADEISYLKRVLDAMFDTFNTSRKEIMAITSTQALRLTKISDSSKETQNGTNTQGNASQGLTMMQAEKMLKTLVVEGWFERSEKSFYTLSPRALMELRGWLIDTYNDDDEGESERVTRIKFCFACKEIITMGQRCPKRACPCRLHDICTDKFFRIHKATNCPLCKTDWKDNSSYVGERVVTTSDEYLQAKRRSGVGANAKKNRPVAVQEAEEVEEQAEEDEEG